ncbi:hypothetical protein [Sporosarcina cyprini]|uniref:hypothetical protein n=1 Tax=Sporosarcina cyprini TaxID=2910523 RepID=UPI001EE0F3DA|nr:hypothetical protein [Sporosarcina cyprini]MCG3087179.1 hypothetical protein [Sporosarcina cyprini]
MVREEIRAVTGLFERLRRDTSCSRIIRVVGNEIRAVLEIYERFGFQGTEEWMLEENSSR